MTATGPNDRCVAGGSGARVIFHVDMDAFFASIEQLDDPALRGKPVLVGSDGPRGVVAAASYEAREFNCHSAQPMAQAKRRCPHAVIVPVRFARYRELSQRMFGIFDEFSPLVEPLSVDEAFLDMTGTAKLLGEPVEVARRLKARIKSDLGLTGSIGVAPNKFLAKLASDLQKPDGLVIVAPGEIDALLIPLPINKLWGVGPVTADKLRGMGIHKVGDIRARSPADLQKLFGNEADRYHRLAHGIDDRPVVPDREAKSIGHEQTFSTNLTEPADVRRVLFEQVEQVGRRLRQHGLHARTVSLKIRYGDFETISRSATVENPTNGTADLWTAAATLFDKWCEAGFRPVRLVGMSTSQLTAGDGQLPLFPDPLAERQKKVDGIADTITKKFGNGAIRRAEGLQ
jgi:nucleotidyltransferase/DNA polymerase involved in DNA repair